ncbi:receptor-like protein eix2 [Quercus suber]|uniref:Receptor-like protein eix2 n=1 Tax=Quercus suber TaxID=58331 RepID=A0AAW0LE15_QUESU
MINLSGNKLTGKLPIEISSLLELVTLTVSGNNLIGEIPYLIGQLKKLETLDLSRNQFSGEIPSSMSEISFLNHLELSYNHLSGKIPLGTQLQSFNASSFAGNLALCGLPLSQKCWLSEQTPNQSEAIEEYGDEFWKWLYGTTGFGFVVGFLGVCGSFLLKDSWRHAYFLLFENMKDWLCKFEKCLKQKLICGNKRVNGFVVWIFAGDGEVPALYGLRYPDEICCRRLLKLYPSNPSASSSARSPRRSWSGSKTNWVHSALSLTLISLSS